MIPALLSSATVAAVGLTSKAFLNIGYCSSVHVTGLHHLLTALQSKAREQGQGVITVCNHISTLDEPLVWGVLPCSYYLRSKTTRWTLGASEVMFTNTVFSTFFRLGQTIETFRGQGVHQPAVDLAIEKLNNGHWIHLFSEGKINQPSEASQWLQDASNPSLRQLPRFKWGVGRMLMEAHQLPIVIPMWLTGFDRLMPEGRPFPQKYMPKPGVGLSITFGKPIPAESLHNSFRLESQHENPATAENCLVDTRIRLTSAVHRAVESLGRSISPDIFKVQQ